MNYKKDILKNGLWVIVIALALVIAVGGIGIGLAWRTDYLDKWLPPNVKRMFGRGEKGKLAFLQGGEVWLINADGAGKEQLTDTEGKIKVFHFSPDGKNLAYILQKTFRTYSVPSGFEVGYKLFLLDLTTKRKSTLVESLPEKHITDFDGFASNPQFRGLNDFAFSHDGTKIAYTRKGVWVLDLLTGEAGRIDARMEGWPGEKEEMGLVTYFRVEWSPTDERILAKRYEYQGDKWQVFDASSKSPQVLASGGGIDFTRIFIDDDRVLKLNTLEWSIQVLFIGSDRVDTIAHSEDTTLEMAYYSRVLEKALFTVSLCYEMIYQEIPCSYQEGQIYSAELDGTEVVKLMDLALVPPRPHEKFFRDDPEVTAIEYCFPKIVTIAESPSGKLGLIVFWNSCQLKYADTEAWVVDPKTGNQRRVSLFGDVTQIEWYPIEDEL